MDILTCLKFFFQDSKSTLDMKLCTVILGIVQIIAASISAVIVDKLGRKFLLLASGLFMVIFTALLGAYFYMMSKDEQSVAKLSWLPLFSLILFLIMYSMGYGPVPWLMMGEIFDPSFKSLALGLIGTVCWVLDFIITNSFGPLSNAIGIGPVFWIFSSVSAVGLIFVIFAITETKGKTLIEIQHNYKFKKHEEIAETVIGEEKGHRKRFFLWF